MLNFKHKNCGGRVLLDVSIENIYGIPNMKIKEEYKLFISFAKLASKNIKIKIEGLRCSECERKLAGSEDIVLQCQHTGELDSLENFRIVYATNGKIDLHPQLLHISAVNKYEKDVKKEGFKVKEVEPKIYLDQEVKNG